MYEEALQYLEMHGKFGYVQAIKERVAKPEKKDLDTITEDDFQDALDKWHDGDRSKEVLLILVNEGIAEYVSADGSYNEAVIADIVRLVNSHEVLSKRHIHVLQDMYAYLEDVNFHSNLEAIELFTGVAYN